jgi:glycerophosphoryl diester phosphodiesterase
MHGCGLSVNTWTVDDPARMSQLLDWGVDGLCTNKPDVALSLIAQRAR